MKKVAAWSAEDVYDWLSKEGMLEYIDALRQTDGPGVLRLNEADFHRPPLSLVSSDGGQQLFERLETLRIETHIEDHKNGHANGHAGGLPNGTSKPQRNGMKDYRMEMVHIPIPTKETTRPSFPTEWGKTGIAFAYAVVCFVTTTIVISVVHERVPPKEHTPPLPDKFFDLFNRVEWAFSICEINGMLLVGLWLIQWILLKHRYSLAQWFSTGHASGPTFSFVKKSRPDILNHSNLFNKRSCCNIYIYIYIYMLFSIYQGRTGHRCVRDESRWAGRTMWAGRISY